MKSLKLFIISICMLSNTDIHASNCIDLDLFNSDVLYDLSSSNNSSKSTDSSNNIDNLNQNKVPIKIKYYNNGNTYMETTENVNKYPILKHFISSDNTLSKDYSFEYFNNISKELMKDVNTLANKCNYGKNDCHLKWLLCQIAYTIMMDANQYLQLPNDMNWMEREKWKTYISDYLDEKMYLGSCNKLMHISNELANYDYSFALEYIDNSN